MKNSHPAPLLTESTPEEIDQTKRLIKDKYDIELPEPDLVRLVDLIKELEWWQKADAKAASPRQFSEEQLSDLGELLEQSGSPGLSQSDVRNQAHSLLKLVPLKEKQRIASEIRGVLVEYRPVPYEPAVARKTAELFKLDYGVTLTEEQLEQVVLFLTRKLWYEVGLNITLKECLDDLILYANKRKRGVRIRDVTLYNTIRKALDETVAELTGKELR